jgi:hypothetical protein
VENLNLFFKGYIRSGHFFGKPNVVARKVKRIARTMHSSYPYGEDDNRAVALPYFGGGGEELTDLLFVYLAHLFEIFENYIDNYAIIHSLLPLPAREV